MDRIKAAFAEQGIGAADIPRAIVVHEVLGASVFFGAWAACYAIRPTLGVARAVPALLRKVEAMSARAEAAIARWTWLRRVPGVRHADPARLGVGLAESMVLRNLARPVTVPAKVWLTWRAVVAFPASAGRSEAGDEPVGAGEVAGVAEMESPDVGVVAAVPAAAAAAAAAAGGEGAGTE
jgi:hypothetical protein